MKILIRGCFLIIPFLLLLGPSSAAGIVVDGKADEWKGAKPLSTDPQGDVKEGISGADIKAIYSVSDGKNIFFMIETYGKPVSYDSLRYSFFIDTNGDSKWDFQAVFNPRGEHSIRDFRVSGKADKKNKFPLVGSFSARDVLEFRLPLGPLDMPEELGFMFHIKDKSLDKKLDQTDLINVNTVAVKEGASKPTGDAAPQRTFFGPAIDRALPALLTDPSFLMVAPLILGFLTLLIQLFRGS